MTEAAATLVLDIDSKKAVTSLEALETKYDETQRKLAQPINLGGANGGVERSASEIKAAIAAVAADVTAMNDRLSNGMRSSGKKAAKSFKVGWQAGLGAFSYDFKYDEAMRAKVVEQGQKLGAEAGKALNAGLTTSAVEAGRRFGAAISEGTASGIKKAEALVASYDAYLSSFGATTANTKFGANFASDGAYRAQLEAVRQRVALEERATAELAKQEALQRQLAVSASKWAAATPSQRASATLAAAQSIYSNKNSSYLGGLAGSSEAASEAASLGSVAAAQAQVDALANAHKKLKPQVEATANAQKMWNAAANEGHAFARGLSGSLGALWMTYGSLIPLMAGAALAGGLKSATTAGAEFAYQLTFVKALGGESAQSIAEIGSAALALSKSSMYGPGELANGLRMLSQAGLDAQQSLQALPTVMNLATVGEMSMEQASLTLVGVMNAFGKSMADLPHIGDMFAKAAALSQTSVVGITEAMKTASVVHEQYGASIEDTLTATTLLAKVNITGTAAGTAYRNMLKDLYTPSAEAAKTLKKLGIETKDANGDLREASAIIADLKAKLADFTQASQTYILGKIFSERGGKEAIQMLTSVGKTWDDLKAKISNSDGFMNDVATQLEMTTKGRFEQALNTFKANMVNAFNASEGPVRNLADALRNLADSPAFIAGINGIVGAMASLATTLVNLTPAIVAFGAAWAAFKLLVVGGEIASAVTGIGTAFTVIAAESALAGGGLAGLLTGLRATGSAAAAAAGATNLGGLASILATLSGPAGWITLGVIALGAMAVKLYDVVNASSPAVTKSQEFIDVLKRETEKLKASNDELEKRNRLMRDGSSATSSQSTRQALEAERATLASSIDGVTSARAAGRVSAIQAKIDKIDAKLKDLSAAESAAMSEQYRGRLETLSNIILTAKQDIARLSEDAKFAGKTVDLTALNNYVKVFSRKDGVTQAEARQFSEQVQRLITDAQKKMLGSGNQTYPADTKEETAALKDAFNARIQALRGYIQQYSEEYNQFVSEQTAKRNEGAISELQLLTSTWEEKSSIIQKEMVKQQQIIDAYGTQKNSSAEVQQERNKLEKMQSELLKARTDYEGKVAKLHERTNDDVLALEKQLGGKLETEYDKQVTAMQGSYAKVLKDLLLDWGDASSKLQAATIVGDGAQVATYTDRLKELEAQIKRVETAGTNALTAASKKDAANSINSGLSSISVGLTALGSDVDKLEADMERDGGWISRIMNTSEITTLINERLPALRAELERLKGELAAMPEGSEDSREYLKIQKDIAKAQKEVDKFGNYVPKVWKDVVGKIDTTFHDGFAAIFAKGKTDWDAFGKSLAQSFKTTVVDAIYQMFARPFVMNVVVSVAGTMGVNGLASAAESKGGYGSLINTGSNAYNLYSGGSGLYNSFALSGVGQGLGLSTVGAGLATTTGGAVVNTTTLAGIESLAGGVTQTAGLTSLGSTIGAAIPYVGAAMLAVTAITSMMKKGGGPKTEGDAYGTLYGSALGLSPADRSGDNWITGTNSNAVVESLLTPIGTSVAGLIKSMGGSANGLSFNLGFSTDPKGTAADNIQSGVMDAAGNYVYRNGRNAERGSYSTELQLEAQRMMVAAVKAADVSQIYKDVAGSVDLYSASAEQLQTVLSNLTAITTLRTAFDKLGLGADNLSKSLIDAAGGTSTLATNLDSYYQNFYSTSERNEKTAKQVADALAAVGVAMPESKAAFRSVVEGLDLTTSAGQAAFAAMMSVSSAFATVADAADTAASASESAAAAVKAANDELTSSILSGVSAGIDDAYSALERSVSAQQAAIKEAYEAQSKALQEQISAATTVRDTLSSLADTLANAVGSLAVSDNTALLSQRKFAQDSLNVALDAARSGQSLEPYSAAITDAISTLSKPSEQLYGSFEDYARAQGQANAALSALAPLADDQLSVADRTLAALNEAADVAEAQNAAQLADLDATLANAKAQIDALNGINTSVLSVRDALSAFSSAIASAKSVNAALGGPASSASSSQTVAQSNATIAAAIANDYKTILGRDPDAKGLTDWVNAANHGASLSAIASSIAASQEGQIAALYTSILGRAPDAAGMADWMTAANQGQTIQQIADQFYKSEEYKLKHFASGGDFAGGLRIVGERGPELEATGASRIFTADQTRRILSGGSNNAELVTEIKALREEVNLLRYEARATATNTNKTAKALERVMPDGDALATRAAA